MKINLLKNTDGKIRQIALLLGASEDQVRAQFKKNAAGLRAMAAKATDGKRINGYTAEELLALANKAENLSNQ